MTTLKETIQALDLPAPELMTQLGQNAYTESQMCTLRSSAAELAAGWEQKVTMPLAAHNLLTSLWTDMGLRNLMRPDQVRRMEDYMRAVQSNQVETMQAGQLIGWKQVPIEPTPNMIAGFHGSGAYEKLVWEKMLAAAPAPANDADPAEKLGERCIDGGKCHHACTVKCSRREHDAPFSDYNGPWRYQPAVEEQKPPAFTVEQIAEECARIGIGILECNSLVLGLKGELPEHAYSLSKKVRADTSSTNAESGSDRPRQKP